MFSAGAKVFIISKLFRSLFFSFFQKNRHMQKASFLLTENKCFPSAALSGINEKDLKQEQSADVILSMHHCAFWFYKDSLPFTWYILQDLRVMWTGKTMISLHKCAGWSQSFLFAHSERYVYARHLTNHDTFHAYHDSAVQVLPAVFTSRKHAHLHNTKAQLVQVSLQ